MKIRYYLIVFFLATIFSQINGQDFNNNWVLGQNLIGFDTASPTSSSLSSNNYGFASISDVNGDLLFYSDGAYVYDKNYTLMQNGDLQLFNSFDDRRVQPIVIVPNPANSYQYYLFISLVQDYLCIPCSSQTEYLYFIVDFSDSLFPNGKVLTGSGYNYLYSSNLGYFGPLTLVKNATNDGYFVVIHAISTGTAIGGELRAYKIDSSGLDTTPVITTIPYNINLAPFVREGEFQSNSKGIIRLSPNNTKFGELIINNYFHEGPNTSSSESSFFTMDFNNDTGVFNNFSMVFSNELPSFTDFEFSNDSDKVYFIKNNIFVKDLTNPSQPFRKLSETNSSNSYPLALHLQRDKNENIVMSNYGSSTLLKIENQNSYSNSTINSYVTLNNSLSYHFLPQLIQDLGVKCYHGLTISEDVNSGNDYKQSSDYIIAENTINSGTIAIYHASDEIILSDGFEAKEGSSFRAYIEDCSGSFELRYAKQVISENNISLNEEDSILVYPNPSNGIINIEFKNEIDINNYFELYDLTGKKVYSKILDSNLNSIDVNNLEKGIYLIKLYNRSEYLLKKILIN